MSQFLEDSYNSCMEGAPDAGHAFGYFGGAMAAAPFAAAAVGETGVPPAWGAGQLATVAAAAAAFDVGKELGTAVGTDVAEGACALAHDAGQGAIAVFDLAHDYFSASAPDSSSQAAPPDASGSVDSGHGSGGTDGGI